MHRTLPVAAAVLLLAQAAIHLQQYLVDGFRAVPVIGPMFLAHAALAVVIAVAVVVRPGWIPAAAGIVLSVGAILFLVLAKTTGVFGFQSGPWQTVEIATILVEVATVLVLAPLASRAPRMSLAPNRQEAH